MSKTLARGVRLSQTLAPFGVGAIYDFQGESLIACDIYHWKNQGQRVHSRRLAEALGVEGFRSAPSSTSLYGAGAGQVVPYSRFPQWLFCPTCRSMSRWSTSKEVKDEPPRCSNCARRPQLVPMRFVMACAHGHRGDVDWRYWAHFGAKEPKQKGCKDSTNLRFLALAGSGAGLQSLRIGCTTCGVSRALTGITSKDTVKAMHLNCPGKQPWEYLTGNKSICQEEPVVLQRGASNVYFSNIRSALDIPPESTYQEFGELTLQVTNSPFWAAISSAPTSPVVDALIQTLSSMEGCSEEQVRLIMRQELGEKKPPKDSASSEADLETDEWLAFTTPQGEQSERSTFLTRHVRLFNHESPSPGSALGLLGQLIDKVVLATKLREVRALVGFNRYDVTGPLVKPDLGRGLKWLPAVEVFGEGIFFSLNEDVLREWEERPRVKKIESILEPRRRKHFIGSRLKLATPRFVLLHTLSHVLIRQLSFQCGYSSASLRERVYAGKGADGEPQAGVLIYTAAGDVEGTLGGLVRQGTPPLLAHTILSALERASWCSSDPICRESPAQGFGGLNLGACHACTLVSETSCENANVLLDRGLLVGTPGGVPGFFSEVLAAAQRDSARANTETLETDK